MDAGTTGEAFELVSMACTMYIYESFTDSSSLIKVLYISRVF